MMNSHDLPAAVDDSDLWAGATADKAGGVVTWSIYGLIENLHVLAFMLRRHAFEAGGVLLAYGYEHYVR